MIILDVNKLEKDFGYGKLFEDVSFSLNEGESISIVGPNGCGKSTLLKIINGTEKADKGQISIKKGAKVAYIDQTASSIKDNRKISEILRESFGNLSKMGKRIKELDDKIKKESSSKDYNENLQKYCDLLEEFTLKGGFEMDSDVDKVINGLGIDKKILNQSYNDLSGGEKTLIQLAKSLLIKPDLLLLDEPTNHLDISRIEWLEDYIKSFRGASVIVSHDRYFLDKMSNKILDLDNGEGKVYSTNYTGFLEEKERDFEKQMADYKDQQALIKKLDAERKYFAERGMATNSSTLTGRAHTLQTKIDRLKKNAVARPKRQKKINVGFNEEKKSGKRIITAKGVTVSTPDGNKILDNIDVDICNGERVAFLGANGSGKSTFVKSIVGDQDLPVEGEIEIGPSVKIGYLPQIIDFPHEEQRLLEYFRSAVGVDEQKARQILAGFEFYQDDVSKRVGSLSGGEKMKVKLAELLQQKINTLIFDEPTNHIDIPTKEVLEDAIDDFDGTLIFVSHDRYFINKFADRIVEFKDGKVKNYLGNYEDYKMTKEKKETNNFKNSLKAQPSTSNNNNTKNVQNNKCKKHDDDWER